jgi:hypothetical protein
MLIFSGDHECGSSSQRMLSVQEAAAYLKVSSDIRVLIAVFLKCMSLVLSTVLSAGLLCVLCKAVSVLHCSRVCSLHQALPLSG